MLSICQRSRIVSPNSNNIGINYDTIITGDCWETHQLVVGSSPDFRVISRANTIGWVLQLGIEISGYTTLIRADLTVSKGTIKWCGNWVIISAIFYWIVITMVVWSCGCIFINIWKIFPHPRGLGFSSKHLYSEHQSRLIKQGPCTIQVDQGCVWKQLSRVPHIYIHSLTPLITRFMGPTWGPSRAERTQVGPMLAPWTLLSGSALPGTGYLWPTRYWLQVHYLISFNFDIICIEYHFMRSQ